MCYLRRQDLLTTSRISGFASGFSAAMVPEFNYDEELPSLYDYEALVKRWSAGSVVGHSAEIFQRSQGGDVITDFSETRSRTAARAN